jgi:trans-aconitate methyltransferase
MSDWTSGYVTDIEYTHGFYREMTPGHLAFASLAQAKAAPNPSDALNICELGCGQGVTANIIAAANPQSQVYANDFNPAQVVGARRLAVQAGLKNAHFFDDSFEQFLAREDLPRFDVISLHGIYSWVSAENRQIIVDFIARKLNLGGVVYISYNTLPGWTPTVPIRRLMIEVANTGRGPVEDRVGEAMDFISRLHAVGSNYTAQQTKLMERFDHAKGMARSYLAHEYFNRDWTPFLALDVARDLADAKVNFVASAHLLDHLDMLNLTLEQQEFLKALPDAALAQTVRDFMIGQQFRKDIFGKGLATLTARESQEAWLVQQFALIVARDTVPKSVKGVLGEATMQQELYGPILDRLAKGAATAADLLNIPEITPFGLGAVIQAVSLLVGAGHVDPCAPTKDPKGRTSACATFNMAVLRSSLHADRLNYLVSPVTGSGVTVGRISQIFLVGRSQKRADLPAYAWELLNSQGQRLMRDGAPLVDEADNLAELRAMYAKFESQELPVLQRLGLA